MQGLKVGNFQLELLGIIALKFADVGVSFMTPDNDSGSINRTSTL